MRILLSLLLLAFIASNSNADTFYGKVSNISPDLQKMMIGHSWHQGCPVGLDQLSYLRVSFWGFDDKTHIGEIIVYKPVAKEALDIFRQLYAIKFPIESMKLPERFPAGDSDLKADNTAGFYCRQDSQTPTQLSMHAFGLAIDLNNIYNPALEGKKVDPAQGRKYLNRNLKHKGMIRQGDPVFLIFANHGWYWGGYFRQVDYQHFTKLITGPYRIDHLQYIPPSKRLKNLPQL